VVRHTNVLFVFGTRPEAIKLCPVLLHMRLRDSEFTVKTCVTAQHRGMLDQVLAAFRVTPDYDLNVMRHGQTLTESTARILTGLGVMEAFMVYIKVSLLCGVVIACPR